MTRGAGRGRRLALLGEEIFALAGFPAESHVWEQASIAKRSQGALFRRIEHDGAFGSLQYVGDQAVRAGIAAAVGTGSAVDHELRLCHQFLHAR